MEVCSTATTKKLASMGRVILFTIQKVSDVSRQKLLTTLDFHLLVKRGKILRKSLNDVVSVSHSRLSCRPHDVHVSFVSPVPLFDYEFSCSSSTPPRSSYTAFHLSGRRLPLRDRKPFGKRLVYHSLPKITDFHVADDDASMAGTTGSSCHVDKAAEEFIQSFYRQLRLQKWMAQEIY